MISGRRGEAVVVAAPVCGVKVGRRKPCVRGRVSAWLAGCLPLSPCPRLLPLRGAPGWDSRVCVGLYASSP